MLSPGPSTTVLLWPSSPRRLHKVEIATLYMLQNGPLEKAETNGIGKGRRKRPDEGKREGEKEIQGGRQPDAHSTFLSTTD